MSKKVQINKSSRYAGTPLYQLADASGSFSDNYAFGVWNPIRVAPRADDVMHIVSQHEIGRLDLLAHKYYNDSLLWWVIADANNISDPITDMFIGQTLRISPESAVREAIQDKIRSR